MVAVPLERDQQMVLVAARSYLTNRATLEELADLLRLERPHVRLRAAYYNHELTKLGVKPHLALDT